MQNAEPGPAHEPGNIEHRMKDPNPHLTLTLSPPIRMGAEREQQVAREPSSADWQFASVFFIVIGGSGG